MLNGGKKVLKLFYYCSYILITNAVNLISFTMIYSAFMISVLFIIVTRPITASKSHDRESLWTEKFECSDIKRNATVIIPPQTITTDSIRTTVISTADHVTTERGHQQCALNISVSRSYVLITKQNK